MCVNVFVSERQRQTETKECHLIPPSSSPLISALSSSSERVSALFTFAADRLYCTVLYCTVSPAEEGVSITHSI